MVEYRGDFDRLLPQEGYPAPSIQKSEVKERHIKDVKKGIFIRFEDSTWMFLATDDKCWEKIKEALNE